MKEIEKYVENEISWRLDKLQDFSKYVGDNLNNLSKRIQEDKENVKVISLGEIQANGAEIDRMCSELSVLRLVLKKMKEPMVWEECQE